MGLGRSGISTVPTGATVWAGTVNRDSRCPSHLWGSSGPWLPHPSSAGVGEGQIPGGTCWDCSLSLSSGQSQGPWSLRSLCRRDTAALQGSGQSQGGTRCSDHCSALFSSPSSLVASETHTPGMGVGGQ